MTRVAILGVPLDALTFGDAVSTVLGWLDDRGSSTAHFCNVHLVVTAHDDRALAEVLRAASLNATDGMPLVWLARRQVGGAERVAGPDLMLAVLDQGRARHARHFLYGGAPGVADRLADRLRARLPGLQIVGTASPPFRALTAAERLADLDRIREARPDYVWVGLGAPKQESWVEEARNALDVAGLLAVGAAFDFHAGVRPRAPRAMQRLGLEWAFRLAVEPRRLWRRYLVTNTRFAALVAAERLGLDSARVSR